jgi:Zn finger protein HypA/HybF involved in hydrogenase expression
MQPAAIHPNSPQYAWWRCGSCNRSYEERVSVRNSSADGGCPSCAAQRARKAYGGALLVVASPTLAAEWCPVQPTAQAPPLLRVAADSHFRARWRCSTCRDEWMSTVRARVSGDDPGCPTCSQASPDASVRHRAVYAEMVSPPTNAVGEEGARPRDLPPHSPSVVAWQCRRCDHRWKDTVRRRCLEGAPCPRCDPSAVVSSDDVSRSAPSDQSESYFNSPLVQSVITTVPDVMLKRLSVRSSHPLPHKCRCGQVYSVSPRQQLLGARCPKCQYYKDALLHGAVVGAAPHAVTANKERRGGPRQLPTQARFVPQGKAARSVPDLPNTFERFDRAQRN